jgi:N-acetyl-anhydromuramyl-L-alanine amidase AmpD
MARRAKPRPPRVPRAAALLLLAAVAVLVVVFGLRPGGTPPGVPEDPAAETRWMPEVKSARWTCIVIHHSASKAGGADRFDDWHRKRGWDELGYHFVVGNGSDTADGQVEVGPRWVAQKHGAHCKTKDEYYNQHGIGICLVGNFDVDRPAERQLQSLRRLVAFLTREFDIPPEKILTHGGVTGQTHCPGKHFNVEALRRSIARRE